jgi:hypothetical protein
VLLAPSEIPMFSSMLGEESEVNWNTLECYHKNQSFVVTDLYRNMLPLICLIPNIKILLVEFRLLHFNVLLQGQSWKMQLHAAVLGCCALLPLL